MEKNFLVSESNTKWLAKIHHKLPNGDVLYNEYSDSTFPIYRIDDLKRKDKSTISN
jgi:hypothetical protein